MNRPLAHASIRHQPDGWHVDAYDTDATRGVMPMRTVTSSFAAAVAWTDRLRRVLR